MSLWGLFAFGLYSSDDVRIQSTMKTLKETLWIPTEVGGTARYENDSYQKTVMDVTGNPWFICTLWLADYYIERADDQNELTEVFEMLAWVKEHALASGVLAEQVHPISGEPLSVSPLTWSHATFVATCQHLMMKSMKIEVCPECRHSLLASAHREDWIEKLYPQTCSSSIHGLCSRK
jgi:glucoamylase